MSQGGGSIQAPSHGGVSDIGIAPDRYNQAPPAVLSSIASSLHQVPISTGTPPGSYANNSMGLQSSLGIGHFRDEGIHAAPMGQYQSTADDDSENNFIQTHNNVQQVFEKISSISGSPVAQYRPELPEEISEEEQILSGRMPSKVLDAVNIINSIK